MRATAQGRHIGAVFPIGALYPWADVPGAAAADVYNDYWWGAGTVTPPAPIQIPLSWLSQPFPLRLERPVNAAAVNVPGGPTGRYKDDASITAVRRRFPFAATLTTIRPADAANLARHTVTFNLEQRTRVPQLIIDLLFRTDAERVRLLRITRGRRVQITGVPANFPEGADSLIVTGITHEIGLKTRRILLTTQAVTGSDPGVAGPWYRLGHSAPGGADSLLP